MKRKNKMNALESMGATFMILGVMGFALTQYYFYTRGIVFDNTLIGIFIIGGGVLIALGNSIKKGGKEDDNDKKKEED